MLHLTIIDVEEEIFHSWSTGKLFVEPLDLLRHGVIAIQARSCVGLESTRSKFLPYEGL